MALHNTATKDEFDEKVIKNEKYVLVDFWAQWCPPCRMMAPILDKVGEEMDETIDVVKVDIEASADNGMLAQTYGVQGIPNMKVFHKGEMVKELVGARPFEVLKGELEDIMK